MLNLFKDMFVLKFYMSYIFVFTLISSLVFGNAISFNDSNVESNVQSECSVFNYLHL